MLIELENARAYQPVFDYLTDALEAEKSRSCMGSFGSVPIQPQTGVHPRSGHT